MLPSPLNFQLEQYEGPLDLLLDLIRKQQINIYDIPIAQITAQYLEYMQRASELDIELSSEFVFMAATLIHIKSRMLLPRDPELDKIAPEEDPREELVRQLDRASEVSRMLPRCCRPSASSRRRSGRIRRWSFSRTKTRAPV